MLKIRLQRTGRKHETTFRIVLTDSKNSTKSGKYKEVLGSYDPRKDETPVIKKDRVKYWLGVGAEASGTVHNLFLSEKVIEGKKRNVLPRKTVPKKEAPEDSSRKEAEAPATEEQKPESETPPAEIKKEDEPSEENAVAEKA